MIEFINNEIEKESICDIKDDILDLILDVIWHQTNGLQGLNGNE